MSSLPVSSWGFRVEWLFESFDVAVNQTAEPYVTEIHQFRILDVSEIGRISEHGIQGSRRQSTVTAASSH